MIMRAAFLCSILLFLSVVACHAVSSSLVIEECSREIDLTSQFATHRLTLVVRNDGTSDAASMDMLIERRFVDHVASLTAQQVVNSDEAVDLSVEAAGDGVYRVAFNRPLASAQSIELDIEFVLLHVQTPLPAEITQQESQRFVYEGNHYVYSKYPILTQTTEVRFASSAIEDYTILEPTSLKKELLSYGPYENIAPLTHSPMRLHYESNTPFLGATFVQKDIDVSHWGNVAVEVTYDHLINNGPKFTGPFSRWVFMVAANRIPSVIPTIAEYLPDGAHDIYYRDIIGNISTSALDRVPVENLDGSTSKRTRMIMKPRFPLMGGWKTQFNMGYNLPLYTCVGKAQSGEFVLTLPFLVENPELAVDSALVRVVLPERATNIQVHAPFAVDHISYSTHVTYLDIVGRPVVEIRASKLTPEESMQLLQISYSFNPISMLAEPLMVIGGLLAFFYAVIIVRRLDLSIAPASALKND